MKRAPPAPSCPWAQQFTTQTAWIDQFKASTDPSSWATEFQSEQKQDGTSSWAQEFSSSNWVEEFHQEEAGFSEDAQMAVVAENLLRTLDLSDPKLSNSKFVAYLRELSKTNVYCPFSANTGSTVTTQNDFQIWKEQYMKNIESLQDGESEEWATMEKGWERYEANGYGYDKFAEREFSNYIFSIPIAANPYLHGGNSVSSLRDEILALEALVYKEPENAEAWLKLGLLQQRNEMDVQALAALLKASKIDKSALIPLAASLTNESCIPEALDALESWLIDRSSMYQTSLQSGALIGSLDSFVN